jgi:hypothetical protein
MRVRKPESATNRMRQVREMWAPQNEYAEGARTSRERALVLVKNEGASPVMLCRGVEPYGRIYQG